MKYFIFIFLSVFLSSQAFAESIEPSDGIDILEVLVAYKKSDVVYIVPVQRVGEFGEKWETSN